MEIKYRLLQYYLHIVKCAAQTIILTFRDWGARKKTLYAFLTPLGPFLLQTCPLINLTCSRVPFDLTTFERPH